MILRIVSIKKVERKQKIEILYHIKNQRKVIKIVSINPLNDDKFDFHPSPSFSYPIG